MTQKTTIDSVERTMESRPPNTVQCDFPGCGAETYVERHPHHYGARGDQRDLARAEAAAKGWAYRDGLDLCPEHAGPP